jgi:maltooligosyltrehalose trehalohydrolase
MPVKIISLNTQLHKIGAWYHPEASEFIVWAPLAEQLDLITDSGECTLYPMTRNEAGYWSISLPLPPSARYRYRIDGLVVCPDPASFSQPAGVNGPSELTDRSFPWQDQSWKGIPLSSMIIYELHTGCFSPAHDFEGIIQQLEYLADLGINTIELMPLGEFSGERNWGYDGVYPFAIHHAYGGFTRFQHLVNAAHARGIAVLVDVVYNHFGPEGSYIDKYGPYFTDKYTTPWGKAINFDDAWSDGVRNYFLQNARMWLEDYHVDGLRLDAVHAIKDFSALHFMQQLKNLTLEIETKTGVKKTLIAEIDLNDPRYIDPVEKGGYGLDGQWIDEFHHALHAYTTGEKNDYSPHRKRTFGCQALNNPYGQFVVFAQNHDQIGNRAAGDRLTSQLSPEQLKLIAACVLLSPYIPLLFMGEEYGETNPFQYFTSFSDPVLIENVRKGRQMEFAGFIKNEEIPDPQAEDTFLRSNLAWRYHDCYGSTLFKYYRHLITFRKSRPAMQNRERSSLHLAKAAGNILILERKSENDHLCIMFHFDDKKIQLTNTFDFTLRKIFDSASEEWQGPGTSASAEISPGDPIELYPHSAIVFEKKPF